MAKFKVGDIICDSHIYITICAIKKDQHGHDCYELGENNDSALHKRLLPSNFIDKYFEFLTTKDKLELL